MREVVIQCVCGVGVGSSQFLKMQIDDVAEKNGLEGIKTFIGDLLSATSANCDAIFTSNELADVMGAKTTVPVVVVNNFVDKKEIAAKLTGFLDALKK